MLGIMRRSHLSIVVNLSKTFIEVPPTANDSTSAASKGFRQVSELLISSGANVNMVDCGGYTPLHEASIAVRPFQTFHFNLNDKRKLSLLGS